MENEKTPGAAFPLPDFSVENLKIEPRFDFGQAAEAAAAQPASTKASATRDAIEEIAEDMVDLAHRLGKLERYAQETTAAITAMQNAFAEHSSYQSKLVESLRRELAGDRKGLALRSVFDPTASALDQLEAIRRGFHPEREQAAFGQVSAAVAALDNLLLALGFSRFTPQIGDPFDPSRMQCLGYVPGEIGVVLQILRKGYLAGDVLARPAGVLIADPESVPEDPGARHSKEGD